RKARSFSLSHAVEAPPRWGPGPFLNEANERRFDLMFYKFHINKDERGLLFRKGDFVRVLHPGTNWVFGPLFRTRVEKFKLDKPAFEHRLAEYIRKSEPETVAREFHVVELGATEVGLRYENGVLVEVLPPDTRRLYWKGYV